MAILNLTPDSFSDGDPHGNCDSFLKKAKSLIGGGADILDIGAESTRPESSAISADEEKQRLLPFLKKFRLEFPNFPISLDTKKYEVAKAAMPYGIQYINDVSFLNDVRLAELSKDFKAHYILMHTRFNHEKMNQNTSYSEGLFPTLQKEIEIKLNVLKGIKFPFDKLILDPGFGFAKTPEQCVELVENLDFWTQFDLPLLIAVSRKRFLKKYLGECDPQSRDALSAEIACKALRKGFYIARVHNVEMTKSFL